MRLFTLILAMMFLASPVADAQLAVPQPTAFKLNITMVCIKPGHVMIKGLHTEFNERMVWRGVSANTEAFYVFQSNDTWTIVMQSNSMPGVACMIWRGERGPLRKKTRTVPVITKKAQSD